MSLQGYAGLLLGISLLAGCQTEPVPETPPEPDPAIVEGLVRKGDAAAAIDHWDHPKANSALDYYQRALILNPESLNARRGIEALMERYLQLARSAADIGSPARARSMLARARLVDPEHPGVTPTEQYIALLSDSQRQELTIARDTLRRRDQSVAKQLRQLGAQARSSDCRTLITTGNDPDYRWIYQRMADAPGENRIRAQFQIGAPNRVVVLCKR